MVVCGGGGGGGVCVRACVRACVCVCVGERERECGMYSFVCAPSHDVKSCITNLVRDTPTF